MAEIKFAALSRNSEKADKTKKYILGEVYGPSCENRHVMVESISFVKLFRSAGVATLIDLDVDGKDTFQVIIKDIQKDPVKDNIIHVDFFQVDMKKKIQTKVDIIHVGESNAVKIMGGILVKNLNNLTIECLPGNLINSVEIDLAKLETTKDVIRVEDVKIPENVIVKNNPRDVVVSMASVRKQKETAETEDATEEKKDEKGEKKDGDKPAEEKKEEKKEDKKKK